MAKVGTTVAAKQPGFFQQLSTLSAVYWVANWMELVERFAYYGVRVVLPVFMVLAIADGGPEFTHLQKGEIYGLWAIVQSYVPILSGPFADRYGYKVNIGASTILKIIGYLLMGYAIQISEMMAGMPLAEARAQSVDQTYEIFFAGAMFLAAGTAIFKPGVQGLIANQIKGSSAASLGWGLFYQMVNIGGFIGPMIAGYLRVLEWEYVFLVCAAGIALNFIPLFFFKEPVAVAGAKGGGGPLELLGRAVRGLLEPRLFFFTIAFAGFWLMFYQLFDLLPNFIDDWVDSRGAASWLASILGEGAVPVVNGGNLTQEWMINFNALLISFFAFLFGYLTGKMRSLTAIILGIGVSALAIYGLGVSMDGWMCIAMIGLFSLGEMAASPTKMRYLASIAPPGREGQYMGYVNMTVGIGWSIGSIVAGQMYQERGDKIELARKYLVEHASVTAERVEDLDRSEVLGFLESTVSLDANGARQLLWDTYQPNTIWITFVAIGVASMLAIVAYSFVTRAANKNPRHSFNVHGHLCVQIAVVPIVGALLYACIAEFSLALLIQVIMFGALLVLSFFYKAEPVQFSADDEKR